MPYETHPVGINFHMDFHVYREDSRGIRIRGGFQRVISKGSASAGVLMEEPFPDFDGPYEYSWE